MSTTPSKEALMVRTDVDLVEEEFPLLPTPKPLGVFCTPIHDRDYALVSRLPKPCYFELIDFAVPFMRMLYLQRIRPSSAHENEREPGGLDFRLYLYDRKTCCWSVAVRYLEFPEGLLRKESKRFHHAA